MTSYRTETNESDRWDDCDLSDSWNDRYNIDFGTEQAPAREITSPAVEVLAQVELLAESLPEPEGTPSHSPR